MSLPAPSADAAVLSEMARFSFGVDSTVRIPPPTPEAAERAAGTTGRAAGSATTTAAEADSSIGS